MFTRHRLAAGLATAAVAVPAVSAATASAASYRVGISDQNANMFDQPAFQALKLKRARFIVPWDWNRASYQIAEVDNYLNKARSQGFEVLVSFNAPRGCWTNGNYSRASRCRAPSTARYRASFKAFRARYPFVKVYSPWNEANHKSQPTRRSPKRAAQYYNVVRSACRGCKIVAADVLDTGGVERYLRRFLHYAKGRPRVWGLHNYQDVNRRSTSGTKGVLKTVPGEVWLTETGGLVAFGSSFSYSESRAAARVKTMFALADKYRSRRRGYRSRIGRLYYYQWTGVPRGERFDAGLTNADGSTRPGYRVFAHALKKTSVRKR